MEHIQISEINSAFTKEWSTILGKLDKKIQYKCQATFDALIDIVNENMDKAPAVNKNIETVKGKYKNLYKLTIYKGNFNIRVIYCLSIEKHDIFLLTAFEEKSKSDYQPAIERAESRKCYYNLED